MVMGWPLYLGWGIREVKGAGSKARKFYPKGPRSRIWGDDPAVMDREQRTELCCRGTQPLCTSSSCPL